MLSAVFLAAGFHMAVRCSAVAPSDVVPVLEDAMRRHFADIPMVHARMDVSKIFSDHYTMRVALDTPARRVVLHCHGTNPRELSFDAVDKMQRVLSN